MSTKHPEREIVSGLDRFAEAISHDFRTHPVTVAEASERAGISYALGNSYIQRLRQRYRG